MTHFADVEWYFEITWFSFPREWQDQDGCDRSDSSTLVYLDAFMNNIHYYIACESTILFPSFSNLNSTLAKHGTI